MEDFLEWPLIIIISTLFLSYLIYVVYLWRKDDKELKELQKNAKCDPSSFQ